MDLDEFVGDLVSDISAVLVFTPAKIDVEQETDVDVVKVGDDGDVELPLDFDRLEDRLRFGIGGCLEEGHVDEGDYVACIDGVFGTTDTVTRVEATESMQTGLYGLFMNSKPDPSVIRDVIELAVELGKKGQKGEPVGALFVIGDAGKVMSKSRPLSYNPFEKSHVHVGDPIVDVMLKEFSRLDGAFVISDSGKIVSAYRYLEADAEGIDIPKGLGTRHMAAASVTRDTNAVSVVLSESDRLVRVFKSGEVVLELDPEEY